MFRRPFRVAQQRVPGDIAEIDANEAAVGVPVAARRLSLVVQRRSVAVETDFVASRQGDGNLFAVPRQGDRAIGSLYIEIAVVGVGIVVAVDDQILLVIPPEASNPCASAHLLDSGSPLRCARNDGRLGPVGGNNLIIEYKISRRTAFFPFFNFFFRVFYFFVCFVYFVACVFRGLCFCRGLFRKGGETRLAWRFRMGCANVPEIFNSLQGRPCPISSKAIGSPNWQKQEERRGL